MSKEKSVYDLGLHEVICVPHHDSDILKVPGGWIYRSYNGDDKVASSCFVLDDGMGRRAYDLQHEANKLRLELKLHKDYLREGHQGILDEIEMKIKEVLR